MGRSSERLRLETAGLKEALRGPISRGRWGEIHLRRVAELSGMVAHCDFFEQTTLVGEGGAQRPDMIVRLPGGKSLIVDAKVPLRAFLEAQESPDDAERERRMGEHARLVRDHVTTLSRKSYGDQLDATPEFVVMFVPGEAFFSAAVQRDPELLEFGFSRGVIAASPTNLVALLKTVHYAWQQEKVAENAERIRDLAVELHDRLGTMTGYFKDLGAQLGKAVDSYNAAIASLQSRVLIPGRKLKEMGVGGSKELPDPAIVESEPKKFGSET
jgi:DNA recombination protein RmuC